jgi:hypothetical protein
MFDNIGSKLKAVAQVFAWLGIGASALIGLIVMFANEDTPVPGLLIIGLGCLGSWISSLGMYGFGQLIENTDKLVAQQRQPIAPQKTQIDDIESNLPEI